MKKQSVGRGVWYKGGRQNRHRERVGFLPIGALAAPILDSLGGVVKKKYLQEKVVDVEDMYRSKILLRQKVTPQSVTLPKGQSF